MNKIFFNLKTSKKMIKNLRKFHTTNKNLAAKECKKKK